MRISAAGSYTVTLTVIDRRVGARYQASIIITVS